MRFFGRYRVDEFEPESPRISATPDWVPPPGRNVMPPERGFQLEFAFEAPTDLLGQITGQFSSSPVSRKDALSVPAVLKARNMIAGIPATLPIDVYNRRREPDDRNTVVEDPHREIPSCVVYAMTIEDLLFHGVSYWRVSRFSAEGFPVEAYRVDQRSVSAHAILGLPSETLSEDLQFSPDDPIFIDGYPVPRREVIRFVSPNPPLLTHGARQIRSALLLDQVAATYADDPMPLGYFTDADGVPPLEDAEVQEVLNAWKAARKLRATGYVPSSLRLETPQWDARKIQLAEARQHAVLEIARAVGLDAEDLGVSTTSRTYQNAEERRQDRIFTVMMPYMTAIEQRLSKDDVLPRGLHARFDLSGFLRSDTLTRMQADEIALRIGAKTQDEVRESEHRPALTAAERAAIAPAPAPVERSDTDERLRIVR